MTNTPTTTREHETRDVHTRELVLDLEAEHLASLWTDHCTNIEAEHLEHLDREPARGGTSTTAGRWNGVCPRARGEEDRAGR